MKGITDKGIINWQLGIRLNVVSGVGHCMLCRTYAPSLKRARSCKLCHNSHASVW